MADLRYEPKAFDAAHKKFMTAPTTLTDADLEQFEAVSPDFAARARLKRDGYRKDVTAGFAEADKKLYQKPATLAAVREASDQILNDYLVPILATYRLKFESFGKEIERLSEALATAAKENGRQRTLLEEQQASINLLLWQRDGKPAVKP